MAELLYDGSNLITVNKNVVQKKRALFEKVERVVDREQDGFNDFN